MKRPLIGVTAGEIVNAHYSWSPITYGQLHTYSDAVIHGGGVPLIIPLTEDTGVLRELYERLDGILLAGGNDINPHLYDEDPLASVSRVSDLRDTVELQLIRWARADGKPILAICRGMQLLNVACGGTLYQDIASQIPTAQDHTASAEIQDYTHVAHQLSIQPGSKLAQITHALTIKSNTLHHQAVKDLAEGFVAVAWAEDGVIEAIESVDDSFMIGVQLHPEALENSSEPTWQKLFTAFAEASAPAATYQQAYLSKQPPLGELV
jgi:putative glutamine amidotransferase